MIKSDFIIIIIYRYKCFYKNYLELLFKSINSQIRF